jgi:tripartite ATP-independent transporter DctM subunit
MLQHGYEPRMACGVVAISGTLAMLIPPSIALILYGIIADVSVGKLLVGGVIPGLLVTLTIALTVLYLVWRDPSCAPRGPRYSMSEKFHALRDIWPMLLLIGSVTGVIYAGIATPTEASAAGAAGAMIISALLGKLGWASLGRALLNALRSSCMIFMILVGAHVFGYFFTLTGLTNALVASISGSGIPAWLVMLAIIALLLILGCFLDQIAILVLTIPVLLPVVKSLGFDPVWFGVIMVITGEVGMVTPPVGLNAFVVARYAKRPLSEVFIGVWPHVVAHILLIAVFLAVPDLILWLPAQMD